MPSKPPRTAADSAASTAFTASTASAASTASTARYPWVQTPLTLGSLVLPHRVLTGSMHLNLETGDPEALAAFYAERARGGAGLILTGGAAVSRAGAGGRGYALINDPDHWARWKQVTEAVHAEGGLIGLQLFHAGRYALESSFGLRPEAPSAVYSSFSRCEPAAMSSERIAETIGDFASGAARAVELGFDAVEIMASEGYLLNQFVSPVTNLRTDEWGGNARRRRAFPVAVTMAVRQAARSLPVLVRISGADLVPNSSTPDEVDALAVGLVEAGADGIDVGIGWHESRIPTVQSLVPHGVWIDTAARIKAALVAARRQVPVIASNRINSLTQAENILAAGRVDMISMARPFLADPDLMNKSVSGQEQLVNTCIGCNEACIDRSLGEEPVSCLVNPKAGRELEFPTMPPLRTQRKHVGVIGAGPAGMEAARALAANGAQVTLWEAGPRIGGQFLMAGMVPGKADFLQTVRYFEHELARLGVRIELNTPVESAAQVDGCAHVIVAAGVRPRPVELPGCGLGNVVDYPAAFADPESLGRRVAVVGAGGIAVDLAHLLAEGRGSVNDSERFLIRHGLAPGTVPAPSRQVTIMRRSGAIGAGMGITTRWAAVDEIRTAGVRTLTNVGYDRITADGVWVTLDGKPEFIEADTVVIAAGQEPQDGPAALLAGASVPHTVIGGARQTSGLNAVAAFGEGLQSGFRLARL